MDVVRPRTGREASNSRNAIRRCRWNPIRFLFRTDRSGPQLGSPLASISHSHSWSRIIGRALALRVARDGNVTEAVFERIAWQDKLATWISSPIADTGF